MNDQRRVKISKYLSKHLRHQPERIGLTLGEGGWVRIDDLLAACRRTNFPLTRTDLDEVVRRCEKQRYAIDGDRIRAHQGHSVDVDLGLEPATPPVVLYAGTASAFVPSIRREGLKRMRRHHVHLSADFQTALSVGARHGVPVVLVVDAATMHADGHPFYRSENGVWLADAVPPEYLRPLTPDLQP